jgi:hypothetical protein
MRGFLLLALSLTAPRSTAEDSTAARARMLDVVTRTAWCDRRRRMSEPRPGLPFHRPRDFTEWQLRADGSYQWRRFTDFVPPPGGAGHWALERSHGAWVVMLSTGERRRIALGRDGTLTVGISRYWPCRPLERDRAHASASLPALSLPERVNAVRRDIVGADWRRVNDMDLNFQPTSVRFNDDWTYVSVYRNGACRNAGTWYATTEEVRGEGAANRCDLRDPTYSEFLHGKLDDGGRLFLGNELYLRAGTELRTGTVTLANTDTFAARMEYELPIRSGRTTTFTVHLHNRSSGPIVLQRFAITRGLVRGYRDAQNRVNPASSELAGTDLRGQVLAAGEQTIVSLGVVFARRLDGVYFNLLMDGPSQPWDLPQYRTIRVVE